MNPKKLKKHNLTKLAINIAIIMLSAYIISYLFIRIDLTSEKRYTLTRTTINTLKSLKDNVIVRVYLDGDELPSGFVRLRNAIKEMLDEYQIYSKVNIDYEFIDPAKDVDEKMKTRIYNQLYKKGIIPIQLQENTKDGKSSQKVLFPGALIIHRGREIALNFLKNNQQLTAEGNLNNSIQSLEYEFTNALTKINKPVKTKIAFSQGHGELSPIQVRDIEMVLEEYYQVDFVKIDSTNDHINDYKLIIVAKPQNAFSEPDKYLIDQFFMNGGKLMWLVDGVLINADSLKQNNETLALANELNIDDILFKYGARVNKHLIEDLQSSAIGLTVPGADGKPQIKLFPWQYFPLITNHSNHPITKYLSVVKLEYASSIDTVGASPLIRKTQLLASTPYSKVTPVPELINFGMINKVDEKLYNREPLPIAILFEGVFPSVFKNRMLSRFTVHPDEFKEQSRETKMIVVADGDIIKNEVSPNGDIFPLGFDRDTRQTYKGNTEFILNAVNYLCDDAGLMSVRARELKLRLLNKETVENEKLKWQLINTLVPVVCVILFGIVLSFIRKRKYSLQTK